MAVKASNLVLGAATLYVGNFGAVEPTDAIVAPASPVWTDLGGTTDGVTITIAPEYTELVVDQVIDRVGSRLTSRSITISTNLAEATLENLKIALSGGTITAAAGKKTFDLAIANNGEPAYQALLIDGIAPDGKKRRIIVRKALSTDSVEFAYSKDGQTVYSVTFTAHFVDNVKAPVSIVDEIAAA